MELLNHFLPRSLTDKLTLGWCPVEGSYSEKILTDKQAQQWRSFKSTKRQREYLATRALIRDMVQQMGINPDLFAVEKDVLGKPTGYYEDAEYHLSIAHTDQHVLCAISENMPVGVDLEPRKRTIPERLRNRILSSREQLILADEQTIRIWTVKEALVKLQGRGMRTNLNECAITKVKNGQFEATLSKDKSAKICSFSCNKNWLAVAWNREPNV